MLENKGYSFLSSQGEMKVLDGKIVIVTAIRRNNLYYLKAETIIGNIHVTESGDLSI